MMVANQSIASAVAGMEGVRFVRDWNYVDSDWEFAESPPPAEEAEVVEGEALLAKPVAPAQQSGFTHFLDGTQKARSILWDGQFPLSLACIAAAILVRRGREMESHSLDPGRPRIFGFKSSPVAKRLRDAGFETTLIDIPEAAGMSNLQLELSLAVGNARESAEILLAVKWLRDESGWLLVDGGIGKPVREVSGSKQIVGVVKSHRKQYFANPDAARTVLGLKLGERTSVFHAKSGSDGRDQSYSWYLRLNESEYGSPAYGLIRVEMAPEPESITMADQVSSWLLAERSPLSMPDPRYDRLLYPIRRVEMYLKSLQPSDVAMRGMLGV